MTIYGDLPYTKVIPIGGQSLKTLDFDDVFFWVVHKRGYPTTEGLSHWQNTVTLKRDNSPVLVFTQMDISNTHDIENAVSCFNKKGWFLLLFTSYNLCLLFLGSMIAFVSEARILVVVISFPNVKERFIPAETLGDELEQVCQITGHNFGWLMLCKQKLIHYWKLAIVSEESRTITHTFMINMVDPWSSCVGLTESGILTFIVF